MMASTPLKRPRPFTPPQSIDVPRLISDMHHAVTSRQRFNVLQDLMQQSSRDAAPLLIEGGILRALCLQLGFCIYRSETQAQVELICSVILSLLHDCCVECVKEESIRNVGGELFSVLVKVWKQPQEDHTNRMTILSIWRHMAYTASGAYSMARNMQLLPILESILSNETSSPLIEEALGILKHISHHVPDSRLAMLQSLGSSLARLSGTGCLTQRSMERQVSICRNLAQTPHVRKAMVSQTSILNALFSTLTHGNSKMVRTTIICLDSLAMEQENCLPLVLHADGMILGILMHFLTSSEDEGIRKRSARSLRLLASAVPILTNVGHEILRELLHSATEDISGTVRREAAMAYSKCASQIAVTDSSDLHGACLDGLTILLKDHGQIASDAVTEAIQMQVERGSLSRCAILQHDRLLPTLALMCSVEGVPRTTRDHASATFLRLVENSEQITEQFVTPQLLTALVCNAKHGAVDAIQVLIRLSRMEEHRKQLVMHQGLLQTLMNHVSSGSNPDSKEAVKQTILLLVPQL